MMTERLEFRVAPETLRSLRQEAHRRGISIGQLVREAIDSLLEKDRARRLEAAQALFAIEASVDDWPIMKQQIVDARVHSVTTE